MREAAAALACKTNEIGVRECYKWRGGTAPWDREQEQAQGQGQEQEQEQEREQEQEQEQKRELAGTLRGRFQSAGSSFQRSAEHRAPRLVACAAASRAT